MSDVIEAALQEVRDFNNGVTEPEAPAPVSPEPVIEAPPEKPRFASLDEVIIDDPRLPESLRGQPASALYEDRTKGWHEAHQKGFQTNRLEAERDAAIALLEKLAARLNETAPEKPAAPPSPMDRFRKHGVEPIDILSDAERALNTTILAGAEEAEARLSPRLVEYEQRIKAMEAEREQERTARQHEIYRSAFLAARPEHVPLEMWEQDYSGQISSYMILHNLPLDKKESYKQAADWVEGFVTRRVGTTAPVPTAPAAPAPPVGGGKPAPVQASKPSAHLNNHQREAYSKVAEIFKRQAPKVDVDTILDELKADPKTRGMFP